jgi:periplasmic divalent cation tolerance protein
MTEFIEIHWTSGSLDEARKIARHLVEEHLVACAQIVPWIESIYIWNNQLETVQESKILFKTRRENYESVKEFIKKNCTYEIPEITYTQIDGGNRKYMEWLAENTHE